MGKGPRRINFVSIAVILAVVAAIYSGVKFIPAYLKKGDVSTILDEARHEASQINEFSSHNRRERLIDDVRDQVLELGDIPEETLRVYFDDDFAFLNVDYVVVVEHPFGKTTELKFEQSVEIERSFGRD